MSTLLPTLTMIDNAAWLAGYAAFQRQDGCPWGNESARRGWLAARSDAQARLAGEVPSS